MLKPSGRKAWFMQLRVKLAAFAKVIISESVFVSNNLVSEGTRRLACEPLRQDGK